MIKPEMVPKEVAIKIHDMLVEHGLGWASAKLSREIAAAALNAWPGVEATENPKPPNRLSAIVSKASIILPLPEQENPNGRC